MVGSTPWPLIRNCSGRVRDSNFFKELGKREVSAVGFLRILVVALVVLIVQYVNRISNRSSDSNLVSNNNRSRDCDRHSSSDNKSNHNSK